MWKARPIIASRIGGTQSQIVHGVSGVLLGENARGRVRDQFTSPRSLPDYLGLSQRVLGRSRVHAAA